MSTATNDHASDHGHDEHDEEGHGHAEPAAAEAE